MSGRPSHDLALSTAWASSQTEDGAELLRLLDRVGLDRLELEYRLGVSMLGDLRQGLQPRGWSVGSVHNFCPLPADRPRSDASGDLYNLASADKEERQDAVRLTTTTMELAADLEARAVVLHLGWVVGLKDRTLTPDAARSGGPTPELEAAWRARQAASPAALDAISFALERLLKRAGQLEISLGLENRFHHFQAPTLDEAEVLLARFAGAPLGYWHDCGHAHNMSLAGLIPETAWLDRLGSSLLGCHLHDAKGPDDHLPPGDGELDWDDLCPRLASAPLKVIELRPGPGPRVVADSARWLAGKFAQAAADENAEREHATRETRS